MNFILIFLRDKTVITFLRFCKADENSIEKFFSFFQNMGLYTKGLNKFLFDQKILLWWFHFTLKSKFLIKSFVQLRYDIAYNSLIELWEEMLDIFALNWQS